MFYDFQGLSKHIPLSFKDDGLDHIRSNIVYPTIQHCQTIDKFDLNLVLININKLKPYRFIEDQTLQPILAKPTNFLLKEPMEVKYSNNLCNQQQVEETYSDTLLNEDPVETIHFSNLFVNELVQSIKGLTIDNLTKRRTNSDLSKLELVQIGDTNLLTRQLVKNQLVSPNFVQNNDISVNLIIGVDFLGLVCLKSCVVLQVLSTLQLQYKQPVCPLECLFSFSLWISLYFFLHKK